MGLTICKEKKKRQPSPIVTHNVTLKHELCSYYVTHVDTSTPLTGLPLHCLPVMQRNVNISQSEQGTATESIMSNP